MNMRIGSQNRRSNSQVLPRVFMLLQLLALALAGYLLYTILKAVGVPFLIIVALLSLIGVYYIITFFMKCRYVAKRNSVTKAFQQHPK